MQLVKTFPAEIVLPTGVFYQKDAHLVVYPADDGERAVLHRHAPFLALLGTGVLRILDVQKQWQYFWVDRGFIEIDTKGHLCILPENIAAAEKIDSADTEKTLNTIAQRPISATYTRDQKQQDLRRTKLLLKAASKIQH